jgi:hypothetical protein
MGRGWKRARSAPRQSLTRQLFFKALKQGLKIRTFVGSSENAVQIQIWTALIAMLILKFLKLRSTFDWSLSNLIALLRQQLFVHRDLWKWMNAPFQSPPDPEPDLQMALPLRFAQHPAA